MTYGIYCLINKHNSKKYIGQSVNIESRIESHFKGALRGDCLDSHLHNAIRKYGKEEFETHILTMVEKDLFSNNDEFNNILSLYERMYIRRYESRDSSFGYNKTEGGDGIRGYKKTKEQSKKQSEAQKGNNNRGIKIRETITNKDFKNIKDAARHFDVSHHDIGWCCEMNIGKTYLKKSKAIERLRNKNLNFEYA